MTVEDRPLKGHGAKTDSMKERAILALLTDRSLIAAAKRAGIADRTLRRWLSEDEDFRAALAEARRATFSAGIERLQALTGRAVATLEDLLEEKKHPAVRLGAARVILEVALSRHDAETLLRRIEALERRQEEVPR